MTSGVYKLLWLRNLIFFGITFKSAMKLYCLITTHTSAIEISHNSTQHDRTKHIQVDRYFIEKKFQNYVITFHISRRNSVALSSRFGHERISSIKLTPTSGIDMTTNGISTSFYTVLVGELELELSYYFLGYGKVRLSY